MWVNDEMFCRGCEYKLKGLTEPRCPECGREFDPHDPKTTRKRPRSVWARRVRRCLAALAILLLVPALAWGWLYWEWRSEQRAVAELRPVRWDYEPILSPWLHDRLGPLGFVLVRYTLIIPARSVTDITPVARLKHLRDFALLGNKVRDLTPLSGLRELESIHLIKLEDVTDLLPLAGMRKVKSLSIVGCSRVHDISPLGGMKEMELLRLERSPITDDSVLSGMPKLVRLDLIETGVTDVRPLAGLSKLTSLDLRGSSAADLAPLVTLKALQHMYVNPDVPKAQVELLQRALPGCHVLPRETDSATEKRMGFPDHWDDLSDP